MSVVRAIWLKFHPLSACSVGDVELIPEDRFKTLEANQYVAKLPEAPKPKETTQVSKK